MSFQKTIGIKKIESFFQRTIIRQSDNQTIRQNDARNQRTNRMLAPQPHLRRQFRPERPCIQRQEISHSRAPEIPVLGTIKQRAPGGFGHVELSNWPNHTDETQ